MLKAGNGNEKIKEVAFVVESIIKTARGNLVN